MSVKPQNQKVIFSDLAELVKESYVPSTRENLRYIGLEHINQQTLSLNSIGQSQKLGSNKYRFRKNDILFGKLRPYFRKVYKPDFDGVCSTDIWVLRARRGIDPNYVFYLVASKEFINESTNTSTGTRMPRADWGHVSKTAWVDIDKDSQKRIGEILGDLDRKIELNRRINETLEQMAQALFKHYFINNPKAEGWDQMKLIDLCDIQYGFAFKSNLFNENSEGMKIVRIRNILNGDSNSYTTEEANDSYKIASGDLLVGMDGEFHVGYWFGGEAYLVQRVARFQAKKGFSNAFIKQIIREPISKLNGRGAKTTVAHLSAKDISEISLPFSEGVYKNLCQIYESIFEQQVYLNEEIMCLGLYRNLLLPRLISGKIKT